MATMSSTELLDWLGGRQFLAAAQVDELRPLLPGIPDAHSLARELIRRDWLAPYQVNQILQGNGEQLVCGAYLLRERLGEGAMGQVFKAWSPRMARLVAVKTISKDLIKSAKVLERFYREMQTAAKLDHPNIALVRDADEVNGRPFLVMDFIDGFNLSQRVKESGPLPIVVAVDYARQAALGLQHALERGVVHRDIKPGNLMVTTAGAGGTTHPLVKILDFGLARFGSETEQAARLTVVGNLLGTIDYISPEQAQNASVVDTRADIYSLGCSLFYLLTGQPPFQGSSVVEKIGPRLVGEPPSVAAVRPDVPAALDAVLRKIMARHPGERYQTPLEVAQALEPFLKRSPAPAPAAPVVESPAPVPVQAVQPAQPEAINSETVLLATPFVAEPVAPTAPLATVQPPFLPQDGEPAEALRTEDNEPSFLNMTATGMDMSTGAAAARAAPRARGPFPFKLALILGGGFLFCIALLVGIFILSSLAGDDGKPKNNASLRINTEMTKLSTNAIVPGDTKRVLVYIKRTGFKGPVTVSLKDLPDGVFAKPTKIPANTDRCDIPFTVSYGTEPFLKEIRVVAECEPEGIRDEMKLEVKVVADKK